MGEIENFNCEGLCQEALCKEKYTHALWFYLCEYRISTLFCKSHYDLIELKLINKQLEIENED